MTWTRPTCWGYISSKTSRDAVGVLLGHGEDDGFAGQLAGLILEADLHDFFPLLAQGVFVADFDFDLGAGVVEAVGVDALLDEGVAVLFAEVHALDALALKAGLRLIQAEIDEEAFFHGLLDSRRGTSAHWHRSRRAGRCRGR